MTSRKLIFKALSKLVNILVLVKALLGLTFICLLIQTSYFLMKLLIVDVLEYLNQGY